MTPISPQPVPQGIAVGGGMRCRRRSPDTQPVAEDFLIVLRAALESAFFQVRLRGCGHCQGDGLVGRPATRSRA
jgi:hypothetical protein